MHKLNSCNIYLARIFTRTMLPFIGFYYWQERDLKVTKLKVTQVAIIMGLLVLQIWTVDKRYLNNDHSAQREFNSQYKLRYAPQIMLF